MDVREAAALARSYFASVYLDEAIEGLRLEELKYDYDEDEWSVTLGFIRPWDQGLASEPTEIAGRSYKEIRISDDTGEVVALRDRFPRAD